MSDSTCAPDVAGGPPTASDKPIALFYGLDLVVHHDLRTEGRNFDFTSTNSTTELETGVSGVLGLQCKLAEGFHLVTEVRMGGLPDRNHRVSDNFSGEFKETDNGWHARLTRRSN